MNDLEFAVRFGRYAAGRILQLRLTTGRRQKLDRTDVTDVDEGLNDEFIDAVNRREGDNASVLGEEKSRAGNPARKWILDPVDGTGEYVDDSVPDERRTTCVAISLIQHGRLVLSVVRNPFRREEFIATAGGVSLLNGRRIVCSSAMIRRGVPYDYSHWNGARFDLRGLEPMLGRPRGDYSAIYQACMVAAGRSAFAAFPGDTIHDIAPGALMVVRAGGRVTDLRGRPLNWSDLSNGALFSNQESQAPALHAIATL